jgi:nucleoid-associated protein YgaU
MAKNTAKQVREPEVGEDSEQLSESYISIGLGLLVVIVVGILLYNFLQSRNQTANPTASPSEDIAQEATSTAKIGSSYTVKAGDTLWSIAETVYKDGFKWTEIAKANNLDENAQLTTGQVIKIPEVAMTASTAPDASSMATATVAPNATPDVSIAPAASPVVEASVAPTASVTPSANPSPTTAVTITGASYKIVAGDTLWSISCRAYGDCYQWTKLASANKLANPDLIYAGNMLSIPR